MGRALVWFRRDLRLADNPAWAEACASHSVLPVFVLEPDLLASAGAFRRAQFFANLDALAADIRQLGGRLHVLEGPATGVLPRYALEQQVDAVYWNADTTPFSVGRDRALEEALPVPVHSYWGGLVHAPATVLTGKGEVSRVFTPFYKKWVLSLPEPVPSPRRVDFAKAEAPRWSPPDGGTPSFPPFGCEGARKRLDQFIEEVNGYPERRDIPSETGTSLLSSDLHFGTIGPRELIASIDGSSEGGRQFVRQLAWRDWYAHLLAVDPSMTHRPVNRVYEAIDWLDDEEGFQRWKDGQTGYPIVDAGMRQLSTTGWMHNRVRMIAASFLVKHLLIDWRRGERFFRRSLVDGDVAQNCGNWQWVAGTGFDAAPYFRVFNPVLQSRKFDPLGRYLREWVPELAGLSDSQIHAPWTLVPEVLAEGNVSLGDSYPLPMVDHDMARERVLSVYKKARES